MNEEYSSHAPIFIAGYMASGKTTLGRALAKATGREFIDLDFRIEQRFHTTVREIFRTRGEEEFRRMEADMLREAGELEDVVIACGGGTPCFHSNMDYMSERGVTVWLDASPERIVERLVRNRSRRPLMADKTEAELLAAVTVGLEQREPYYSRAMIKFNGDNLENRYQIEDSVRRFFTENPDLAYLICKK